MKRYVLLCVAIAFVLATLTSSQAEQKKEWWNWRGPNFNGTAANDQQPPTSWSDTENVIWKAVVPGSALIWSVG